MIQNVKKNHEAKLFSHNVVDVIICQGVEESAPILRWKYILIETNTAKTPEITGDEILLKNSLVY